MKADLLELGTTGLKRQAGVIDEEILKPLKNSSTRWKTFLEMSENESVLAGFLYVVHQLVGQIQWSVAAASDESVAVEAAEFIESCMDDMSHTWKDFVDEALSMLVYGWSYHETVYKLRKGPDQKDPRYKSRYTDGRVGWRKLPGRSQLTLDRWEFDDEGGIRGMWQQDPNTYQRVLIPIDKALLFRTTARNNNPEGKSIIRSAYVDWYHKKKIQAIEGIGIERDLAGLPVAWVPKSILGSGASAAEKTELDAIKKIVGNIRNDEQAGVVWPLEYDERGNKLYDLTLLSTGGRRLFDTSAIITRHDLSMLRSVAAEFFALGSDGSGSLAMSISKADMFTATLDNYMDRIAGVVNNFGVARLMELNGIGRDDYPAVQHGSLKRENIQAVVDALSKLSASGMPLFPDPAVEGKVRQLLGLPSLEESAAAGTVAGTEPPPA